MRMFRNWTLALIALAVWVTPARPAEEKERLVPEEGAVQVMLLRQKSIQEALKLTEDEAQKIDEFTVRQWKKAQQIDDLSPEERHQKFLDMTEENERFLDEILEPDQRRRLDQITLQVAGLLWVTRPEVASKLQLADEQKDKARQLQREARKEMQDLIHSATPKGKQEKLRELRMTCRKRLMDVLTDAQEAKWKEMVGEPFVGQLHFGPAEEEDRESTEK